MGKAKAYRFITLERKGIVWHLFLNRPQRRNALNHAMMGEIGEAIGRVAADAGARRPAPRTGALPLRKRAGT